jgi:putative effector of murein hydrolase LrgA (UPF0299 family)
MLKSVDAIRVHIYWIYRTVRCILSMLSILFLPDKVGMTHSAIMFTEDSIARDAWTNIAIIHII